MNDDAPSPDAISDPNADAPAPPTTAFDPDPADPDDRADGGHGGGFDRPIDADFPTAPAKGGLTAALVTVGAGLLGAAVLISRIRARTDDKLHWGLYAVGLAATVVLLGLALFGAVNVARRAGGAARGDLVTWPGVVGILAVIPMIEVGLGNHHEGKWRVYLFGGLLVVLAAVGYILARRAAFVVVCVLGLGILYVQVFSDTVRHAVEGKNPIVVFALAAAVFVVAATVLGWLLPSRDVTGVVVGVVGLVAVGGAMGALFLERSLAGLLGDFSGFTGSQSSSFGWFAMAPSRNPADYTGDVAAILVAVAVLTVLWALAALVSDHSGFKVLAVALPAVAVPLGTVVLAVRHPIWWEAGLGVVGAVLVALALLLARGKARRVARL